MQDYNLKNEATSGIITTDVRLIHLMLMLMYNTDLYLNYEKGLMQNLDVDYTLTSIKLHKAHLKSEAIRYIDSKSDPVWDGTIERQLCEVLTGFDYEWDIDELSLFCINYSGYIQQIRDRLTQKDRRNLDILHARFLSPIKKGY